MGWGRWGGGWETTNEESRSQAVSTKDLTVFGDQEQGPGMRVRGLQSLSPWGGGLSQAPSPERGQW